MRDPHGVGVPAPRGAPTQQGLRGPEERGRHLLHELCHPAALHDPRGPPGHLHRKGTLTVIVSLLLHYWNRYLTILLHYGYCHRAHTVT